MALGVSDPREADLLQRYLRYLNYAEELRVLAANKTDGTARDLLIVAAENYDQAGASIRKILLSKRDRV